MELCPRFFEYYDPEFGPMGLREAGLQVGTTRDVVVHKYELLNAIFEHPDCPKACWCCALHVDELFDAMWPLCQSSEN